MLNRSTSVRLCAALVHLHLPLYETLSTSLNTIYTSNTLITLITLERMSVAPDRLAPILCLSIAGPCLPISGACQSDHIYSPYLCLFIPTLSNPVVSASEIPLHFHVQIDILLWLVGLDRPAAGVVPSAAARFLALLACTCTICTQAILHIKPLTCSRLIIT